MKPDWTLIANSTRARLLQQEPGAPMVILESFVHPASRSPARGDVGERAGQPQSRRIEGAALAASLGALHEALTHFARELGHLLEQEAQLDHFGSLTVFASRPFLHELDEQFGKCTRRRLTRLHEMDLTHCTVSEIEERIAHEVAAAR